MYVIDVKSKGNKRQLHDFDVVMEPGDVLKIHSCEGRLIVLPDVSNAVTIASVPTSFEPHTTADAFYDDQKARHDALVATWPENARNKKPAKP